MRLPYLSLCRNGTDNDNNNNKQINHIIAAEDVHYDIDDVDVHVNDESSSTQL